MKKVLKNKKGFTLVELLAVIVVLAIIMVIATQQIGNVIKKNTVNSFKSSLDMVTKQAKQAEVMATGTVSVGDIKALVDYDSSQFEIYLGSDTAVSAAGADGDYVCIMAGDTSSKFNGMDATIFAEVFTTKYKTSASNGIACAKFK